MNIIDKVIDNLKKHGLLKTFIAIGKRIIFQREKVILISRSLDDPIPEVRSHHNLMIRTASFSDINDLYQLVKENNYGRTKKDFFEWIKKDYFFFSLLLKIGSLVIAVAHLKLNRFVLVILERPLKRPFNLKVMMHGGWTSLFILYIEAKGYLLY